MRRIDLFRLGGAALAAGAVLAVASCDTIDSLLEANNPEEIREEQLDDETLVAFGQKCTHLACAVIPDLPNRQFVCPCHRGFFDAENGQPLAGPPRRPLPKILLEVRDGVIHAIGVELST